MHLRIARLALVAAAALALSGCVLLPPGSHQFDGPAPCSALGSVPYAQCSQAPDLVIEQVVVTQRQALPDFDGGPSLQTEPAALDELEQILGGRAHGDVDITGGCAGGRTTVLEITTTTSDVTVTVDTCTDDQLAEEIDELATSWVSSGTLPPAP